MGHVQELPLAGHGGGAARHAFRRDGMFVYIFFSGHFERGGKQGALAYQAFEGACM